MKIIQKYLYWLICTAVFVAVFLYGFQKMDTPLPQFCIDNGSRKEEISIYEAQDGNSYVFLPSYADMEHVSVVMPFDYNASLGDIQLSNGLVCSDFSLDTPYKLNINGQHISTLWFYQSANVSTLYIHSATGSMEHIHRDKNYEESISAVLYTVEGEVACMDAGALIKGRGNSTWEFEKKPYSLIMSSDVDLLGMGAASNWILLANATDKTNLHNKLVYDLAGKIGFEWSPEGKYVDLYLNGDYNGLYLLTEKIEVGPNRLDIDTEAGEFLCKIDLPFRFDILRNPFISENNRTVEISAPEAITKTGSAYVEALVNQMEQTLLSDCNLKYAENIDLDSWVRRYLIDEISGNIDSDNASSYFYYSDGKFYAGPVWDYDMTFGSNYNTQNPNQFVAKRPYLSDSSGTRYYSVLYRNKSFFNQVQAIYQTDFLPLLNQLISGGIQELSTQIASASMMNEIRWAFMYESLQSWDYAAKQTPEELTAFLAARMDFLNSVWVDNIEYCTVRINLNQNESYWTTSVKKGTVLETDLWDLVHTQWLIGESGTIFDPKQPITEDLTLFPVQPETDELPRTDPISKQVLLTLLSVLIFTFLLVCMLIADMLCRVKERRNQGDQSRTTVSP